MTTKQGRISTAAVALMAADNMNQEILELIIGSLLRRTEMPREVWVTYITHLWDKANPE